MIFSQIILPELSTQANSAREEIIVVRNVQYNVNFVTKILQFN